MNSPGTPYYWKLEGKTPVPVYDLLEWAKWFDTADRIVKQDSLPGEVRVSTVFLGIDHGYFDGHPLLFETMVFSPDKNNNHIRRYSTWEEAEAGHEEIIHLIQHIANVN